MERKDTAIKGIRTCCHLYFM